MKTISIPTLREQISKRITNYQNTIKEIQGNTEWHNKQTRLLEGKITELQWMLEIIPEPKPFTLPETIDDGIEEKYLESTGIFQRDEQGLFSYISDNGKHMSNLVALLEDFREHLVSINETNNHALIKRVEEDGRIIHKTAHGECVQSTYEYQGKVYEICEVNGKKAIREYS